MQSKGTQNGALTPLVDIVHEGDSLVVLVTLPGIRPSDLRVTLAGNRQISVEGTIPYRHPVPKDNLTQSELPVGCFSRKVDLLFTSTEKLPTVLIESLTTLAARANRIVDHPGAVAAG
jgi:HSP20 family molecular chaperone IbpA